MNRPATRRKSKRNLIILGGKRVNLCGEAPGQRLRCGKVSIGGEGEIPSDNLNAEKKIAPREGTLRWETLFRGGGKEPGEERAAGRDLF